VNIVHTNPERNLHVAREHHFRLHPNLSPSPELSYVLGAFLGDGSIIRNKIVTLKVADIVFAEKFAECLAKVVGTKPYPLRNVENKYWIGYINNKGLAKFLSQNTLQNLIPIVEKYPEEFVRGFFDAEGTVSLGGRKKKQVKIIAYNNNVELIKLIQKLLLKKFDIDSSIYIHARAGEKRGNAIANSNCYALMICRKESVLKFRREIGFSITRKMRKLESMILRNFIFPQLKLFDFKVSKQR
jgi:intein-encoded DNA endonuclease-like protein